MLTGGIASAGVGVLVSAALFLMVGERVQDGVLSLGCDFGLGVRCAGRPAVPVFCAAIDDCDDPAAICQGGRLAARVAHFVICAHDVGTANILIAGGWWICILSIQRTSDWRAVWRWR